MHDLDRADQGDREGGYAVHDLDRGQGGWLCCA